MCCESPTSLRAGKRGVLHALTGTTPNANLDGTGTLVQFDGDGGTYGFKVTSIRYFSRDATPAETYRLAWSGGLLGDSKFLFHSKTIAAAETIESATDDPKSIGDDLVIPPGYIPWCLTVGGENADIYLLGYWLVPNP